MRSKYTFVANFEIVAESWDEAERRMKALQKSLAVQGLPVDGKYENMELRSWADMEVKPYREED